MIEGMVVVRAVLDSGKKTNVRCADGSILSQRIEGIQNFQKSIHITE
jgi:hypothetical protein